jgi:hypothetical protein
MPANECVSRSISGVSQSHCETTLPVASSIFRIDPPLPPFTAREFARPT